ncbi:hypothetical protein AB4240_00925, partial [Vibrio splendidus]
MTRARNKSTGEVEDASRLNRYKNVRAVPKDLYECPNSRCRRPATPWAVNTPKRSPAFQYNKHHVEGCHYEGMNVTATTGSKSGNGSFRLQHVTDFNFPPKPKTKVVQITDGDPERPTNGTRKPVGRKTGKQSVRSQQSSYMLGALVDFYLEDIEHNSRLPLNLLSRPLTYGTAFQEITSNSGVGYNNNYIFYCEIKNSVNLEIEAESISVELMKKNHNGKNYKVVFDCSDWTEHQKSSLIEMFEYSKQLAKKAYFDNRDDKAFAFFIGRQDNVETNLFHCRISQFAHVHVGTLFKLADNDEGIWWLPRKKKIGKEFESTNETEQAALPEPEP